MTASSDSVVGWMSTISLKGVPLKPRSRMGTSKERNAPPRPVGGVGSFPAISSTRSVKRLNARFSSALTLLRGWGVGVGCVGVGWCGA